MIHLQQWTSGDGCGSDGLLTPVANFSSDPRVSTFCACFLLSCANTTVPAIDGKKSTCDKSKSRCSEVKRAMASVLYECASQEKMEMLPAWIEIFRQATLNTYLIVPLFGDTLFADSNLGTTRTRYLIHSYCQSMARGSNVLHQLFSFSLQIFSKKDI